MSKEARWVAYLNVTFVALALLIGGSFLIILAVLTVAFTTICGVAAAAIWLEGSARDRLHNVVRVDTPEGGMVIFTCQYCDQSRTCIPARRYADPTCAACIRAGVTS